MFYTTARRKTKRRPQMTLLDFAMDTLLKAMQRLHESIDSMNEAIDQLNLEVQKENDRLQRTLDANGQIDQTDGRCPSEASPFHGLRLVYDAAQRDKAADQQSRRHKARMGIPVYLRDII